MTGEITLRGRVLPIGGLKEKSLAAFRAGIKIIVIPERNEKDLDEVPKSLRRKLRWIVVKNMSDVLKIALLAGHNGARRAAHTVASKTAAQENAREGYGSAVKNCYAKVSENDPFHSDPNITTNSSGQNLPCIYFDSTAMEFTG